MLNKLKESLIEFKLKRAEKKYFSSYENIKKTENALRKKYNITDENDSRIIQGGGRRLEDTLNPKELKNLTKLRTQKKHLLDIKNTYQTKLEGIRATKITNPFSNPQEGSSLNLDKKERKEVSNMLSTRIRKQNPIKKLAAKLIEKLISKKGELHPTPRSNGKGKQKGKDQYYNGL